LDAADAAGMTAAHCAAASGHKQVALTLVARGADLQAKTKDEETVLDLAGDMAPALAQVAQAARDGTLDSLDLDI